ncbi:MAG: hypothetical protein K2W95_20870 [Candidatus Obscuribacterales bacterium]|nr:hypothetical protein [Candidatus Obscuribacterales bacterium]
MDDAPNRQTKNETPDTKLSELFLIDTLKDRADAVAVLEKNFKELDKDENGYLSSSELNKEINKRDFSSNLFQAAYLGHKFVSKWQKVSNDEWGFESKGISKDDLSKFVKAKETDDFVKEFDRALAGCKNLTKDKLADPKYCAKELTNGNTIPLALALDFQKTGIAQTRFFNKVSAAVDELVAKDKIKSNIRMTVDDGIRFRSSFGFTDGDIRLIVERTDTFWPNSIFGENNILQKRYCPHTDTRYSSQLSMPEFKKK